MQTAFILYLQTDSFFVNGGTFNKTESMISDSLQAYQVVYEFSCWHIPSAYPTLAKFEFPTRTSDKI